MSNFFFIVFYIAFAIYFFLFYISYKIRDKNSLLRHKVNNGIKLIESFAVYSGLAGVIVYFIDPDILPLLFDLWGTLFILTVLTEYILLTITWIKIGRGHSENIESVENILCEKHIRKE